MTLLSAMTAGKTALAASQIGLRVAGNNIANANTPGYIRQELLLASAPTQRYGNLQLGLGVRVTGVQQHVDQFIASRLRDAKGDLAASTTEREVYREVEALFSELNDSDLSTGLSRFFGTIHDIANQPDSAAARNVAILEGRRLTADIRRIDTQLRDIRDRLDSEVNSGVDDVNRLIRQISQLNVKIASTEGGSASGTVAVGLRDQRFTALEQLAEWMGTTSTEQADGTVSVFLGGDFLISGGTSRLIEKVDVAKDGFESVHLQVQGTGADVRPGKGRLAGLLASRDEIVAGTLAGFDDFTRSLIHEFNKVFSSGQGLEGFTEASSEHRVSDPEAPLDAVGLPFDPTSGSFRVLTRNRDTGHVEATEIAVSLNGLTDDTSLEDVRAALDAIDGLEATIDDEGKLRVATDRSEMEFAFADDSTGLLASLGIGTFFSGSSARDIGVSDYLDGRPELFAVSAGGFGSDSDIAVRLAGMADAELEALGGRSISVVFQQLTVELTQSSAAASAVADGAEIFHNSIEAEHLSIIGVNLDEEAVRLLTYQRTFEASARVISTANEMLQVLVNL